MDFFASLVPYYPQKEIDGLKRALDAPSGHGLYLNATRLTAERFRSLFPQVKPHPQVPNAFTYDDFWPLGKSLWHNLGCFYVMDPASMLPPYYLAPKPGERVLDLCAAPGGKTAVMACLLGEDGVILSNDISYSRSLETSRNVERLGLSNVAVTCGDFARCHVHYERYFDAILLDAPCSGSAMFRKDRRLYDDWGEAKVASCAKTQAELLDLAATMLVPGGRIMYSTCSFSYEEDEAIVLSFLKEHPEFEAVPLPKDDTLYAHPSLPEAIHVFPHRHVGEGQFLCLLRHKGEHQANPIIPNKPAPKEVLPLLREHGLEGYDVLLHQDTYHALSKPLRIEGLSLIRYGVPLVEKKPNAVPCHALALVSKRPSVPLTDEQARAYLRGETFPLNEKDGFAVVSYQGLSLGFVKVVHGTAKNHYPKGLRRDYLLP